MTAEAGLPADYGMPRIKGMTVDYDRRIARAQELAGTHPESAELLSFYCGLASIQRDIFNGLLSGSSASDLTGLRAFTRHFPRLIELVEREGPERLAAFARERLGGPVEWEHLLTGNWEGDKTGPVEAQFFARVLLQPYAESLAQRGTPDKAPSGTCPFCSGKPVVAVLRGEGEGAKRSLICSVCSTEWPYRRIVCPNCGEENKDQLPVYVAERTRAVRAEETGDIRTPEAGSINVTACDTCKCYLKSVDLTKDGHAVPVVDELATVALNIWAEERGYVKFETNLLGM